MTYLFEEYKELFRYTTTASLKLNQTQFVEALGSD